MMTTHINLTITEDKLEEGARLVLETLRPTWNSNNVKYKLFTDGITNKLLGCFNDLTPEDVILVRVYGHKSDLLIDRKAETKNFKLLHEHQLAPQLYATFENGLVYEYLPGEVLTVDTCHSLETYPLVAARLAAMHRVRSDTAVVSLLWKRLKQFLNLIPEQFTDHVKQQRSVKELPSLASLQSELNFLESELTKVSTEIVFSHNDLLLANVIYNADKHTVTFIDYEYAGYSYQAFDIANHFNEYAGVETVDYNLYPTEEYQKNWLRIYLSCFKDGGGVTAEDVDRLYHQVDQFSLASHFQWGLWSLVQSEHSKIDFDFFQYGIIRFNEYFRRKKIIFNI